MGAAARLCCGGLLDTAHAEPAHFVAQPAPTNQIPVAVRRGEDHWFDIPGGLVAILCGVADANHLLPGHRLLKGRSDGPCSRLIRVDPDAACQFVDLHSGPRVEYVHDLPDGDRGKIGVRRIRGGRDRCQKRHRLSGGQAHRWEVGLGGQTISTARSRTGPDRSPTVLKRSKISLDRAHRHPELVGQPVCRASTRPAASQHLRQCVEPLHSLHLSTHHRNRAINSAMLLAERGARIPA